MNIKQVLLALFFILIASSRMPAAYAAPVEFPGTAPGKAQFARSGSLLTLENNLVAESWETGGGRLRPVSLENRLTHSRFDQTGHEAFRLATLTPGPVPPPAPPAPTYDLAASDFQLSAPPVVVRLRADKNGIPIARRSGGVAIEADLASPSGIRAHWHAELRDGSSYLRQTLMLTASTALVTLRGVELTDTAVPAPQTIGTSPGCPVAGGGMFFGVEMPGARNVVTDTGARIGFACQLQLTTAAPYEFGAVVGVAPLGQLRRAFLFYVERERARPSQPFLHYNDWYDLGMDVSAAKIEDVARQFNRELVQKRGVPVLSYLIDDGWDNPTHDLWQENPARFPAGFRGLAEKLRSDDAHLSIWISPLGGYSYANERTNFARSMGLIPQDSGLDLAQPDYKNWFQNRCLQLMREDGVNAFKWDRAGDGVSPHFMALLDIARTLRQRDPAVFLNVTVGTWPSPFWLNHIDSTWRNGSADVGWTGVGDDREKWITYRDGYCHKLFVVASPLYPLNSVMHHGLVLGRVYQGERLGKVGTNFKSDARAYFANGTMLQEMYITPSLMTSESWDALAESAKWAHANADVLIDSHWVGGDPLKLEPYGYASWNRRKGTLMLRNPADKPQTIALDAATVFELPPAAPQHYALRSPYADQRLQNLTCEAGKSLTVTLQPFEVLVFDANPQ